MDSQKRYPPNGLAWSVWGVGALFYVTGFYQRVAPAVMTTELMRDFQVGALALGNLSAFHYYTYVAMQIPTGILVDSLGPKKLLTLGAMAAALGTFVFAIANSFFLACLGRGIAGGSVAVAWVVMLKLATHWFPPTKIRDGFWCGTIFRRSGSSQCRCSIANTDRSFRMADSHGGLSRTHPPDCHSCQDRRE